MLIRVTSDHIRRGQRNTCADCPIALAVRDALAPSGGAPSVFVSAAIAVGGKPYPCPPEVEARWKAFDLRGAMEPFEFELDAPDLVPQAV